MWILRERSIHRRTNSCSSSSYRDGRSTFKHLLCVGSSDLSTSAQAIFSMTLSSTCFDYHFMEKHKTKPQRWLASVFLKQSYISSYVTRIPGAFVLCLFLWVCMCIGLHIITWMLRAEENLGCQFSPPTMGRLEIEFRSSSWLSLYH